MSVYITGDVHGGIGAERLAQASAAWGAGDFVIVLGDFGFPWRHPESEEDAAWLDWMGRQPWTLLFVDGNHENFDALSACPVADWAGGSVRLVRDNVLHLRRGEVFEIEGSTFFAMGGAYSVDRALRTPGVSWWPQEVPTAAVRKLAAAKVAEVGGVDYVLSHCPPTQELYDLALAEGFGALPDEYNNWLQTEVADKLRFKQWFYGHMHLDRPNRRPFTPLFETFYDVTA